MARTNPTLLAHLKGVVEEWDRIKREPDRNISTTIASQFITSSRAVIRRVAGLKSAYADQAEAIVTSRADLTSQARQLGGVVSSLNIDASSGYLESASELLRGDLFADFLDMAQHLLDEKYKDAAAVITLREVRCRHRDKGEWRYPSEEG